MKKISIFILFVLGFIWNVGAQCTDCQVEIYIKDCVTTVRYNKQEQYSFKVNSYILDYRLQLITLLDENGKQYPISVAKVSDPSLNNYFMLKKYIEDNLCMAEPPKINYDSIEIVRLDTIIENQVKQIDSLTNQNEIRKIQLYSIIDSLYQNRLSNEVKFDSLITELIQFSTENSVNFTELIQLDSLKFTELIQLNSLKFTELIQLDSVKLSEIIQLLSDTLLTELTNDSLNVHVLNDSLNVHLLNTELIDSLLSEAKGRAIQLDSVIQLLSDTLKISVQNDSLNVHVLNDSLNVHLLNTELIDTLISKAEIRGVQLDSVIKLLGDTLAIELLNDSINVHVLNDSLNVHLLNTELLDTLISKAGTRNVLLDTIINELKLSNNIDTSFVQVVNDSLLVYFLNDSIKVNTEDSITVINDSINVHVLNQNDSIAITNDSIQIYGSQLDSVITELKAIKDTITTKQDSIISLLSKTCITTREQIAFTANSVITIPANDNVIGFDVKIPYDSKGSIILDGFDTGGEISHSEWMNDNLQTAINVSGTVDGIVIIYRKICQ